jgi:hypothetical protein
MGDYMISGPESIHLSGQEISQDEVAAYTVNLMSGWWCLNCSVSRKARKKWAGGTRNKL